MTERRIFRDRGRESVLEDDVAAELADRDARILAACHLLITANCPDQHTLQWARDFVAMTQGAKE
jgi:hypothetical protein